MRITSKGQVTIPIELREQLGLLPGGEVSFEVDGNALRVIPAGAASRGQRIADHLSGRGRGGLSTDEIMALTRGEA